MNHTKFCTAIVIALCGQPRCGRPRQRHVQRRAGQSYRQLWDGLLSSSLLPEAVSLPDVSCALRHLRPILPQAISLPDLSSSGWSLPPYCPKPFPCPTPSPCGSCSDPCARRISSPWWPHPRRTNPDYSRSHTNPKRKRGLGYELSSLTLRVSMARCAP